MNLEDKYPGISHLVLSKSGDRIEICAESLNTPVEDAIVAVLADYPSIQSVLLKEVRGTEKLSEALLRLPKLTALHLYCAMIPSLSFLSEAKHFRALSSHHASTLKGLEDIKQLKVLSADSNVFTDMSKLEPLQDLEKLSFSAGHGGDFPADSEICDVRPLKNLPKLNSLSLGFAEKDLSGFAELKQLKILSLSLYRGFSDLEPIGKLIGLEELALSVSRQSYRDQYITDISPLAELINLKFLRISYEKVKSLKPLSNMTKLQKLYVPGNHIRTVKPLAHLTSLTELRLYDNSIRSIDSLRNLEKLAELIINNNPIKDYSPIRGMPNYKPEWEEDLSARYRYQPNTSLC